jgi:5'-deoxynucleotidase YfbR-like HD superfamily hydrolase
VSTLFERIRYHRMAAAIERCHLKPHLMRYSVGHHTHDVVTLLIQCWREAHNGALPRAELLVAAHIHDHPELIVGDIPSPVKDLLEGKLDHVEHNVERWLGLHPELTGEEHLYLASADRFELWLWCYEEMARGNQDVRDWADAYHAAWVDSPLPWPFMDLIDEVLAAGGVPHVPRSLLNEAGGLS